VVYGADLAHRNQQLKFIAASLSTKALQSYVPLIVKEAEDFFAKWDKSGVRRPPPPLLFLALHRSTSAKSSPRHGGVDAHRLLTSGTRWPS
jgi:hypothetical protein